jgi:type I restriction-modification system DNA methylase subunit
MANIFPTQKLRAIAGQISTDEVLPKIEIINTWLTDYRTGSLKTDKETSREQAFNQDFFIKILGYEEKPHSPYSFEPKATTSGGQLPDAIVGYLHTDETRENQKVSAVVELKGAAIVLDKPQRREGNMSPVQQGFKYKTQYKHCPFVIVSNFWEFRLYQDNQLDYELWTLEDLANPRDDYINFKTFYYLLQHNNFVPKNGEGKSKTEELLSDIRIEQEDISKKFYKVYKDARLELLRNMYKNNKLVRDDIDLGVEKAQKIIDRIVFACFSEDRGLLPDNTMQRVLKVNESAYGSLWSTLKGFFNAIDVGSDKLEIPRGYNGGLFRNDAELNELIIDDEPLHVVAELSRYDFNEDLSVQILGHIFEQSISDLEEIKQKAETIVEEADKPKVSKRKKDGIFYTPDYIVKYIVENSLGEYLREAEEKCKKEAGLKGDINDKSYAKREHQAYSAYQLILQKVTVCDPACGSGAFLVQVFDFLLAENKRVAAILDGDKVSLFNTDAAIKSILQNNIYGVDLNNESVEITRLSLWLKSAAKGKKLTTLDGNIKCGNSLIDDPEVAGDKAFNWHIEFPDIFADGGFDVVVGNPPYVNFANLPVEEREYYKNSFSVYKNKTDLYAFFVERSTSILRAKGSLGYIFPHTWTTTTSFQPLRELIINNYKIQSLVDLGHGIFTDAVVKTVILVLRKGVFDGIPIFNSEFVKQVVIPRKVIELSDD